MKRISILNFKGGVGKTSISTNAAHKLAMMGYKVLLIDCDIQHNASNLIPQKDRKTKTLTHVIKGEATFEDAIQKARENLGCVPPFTPGILTGLCDSCCQP
jgi:chromosome partitioning protein